MNIRRWSRRVERLMYGARSRRNWMVRAMLMRHHRWLAIAVCSRHTGVMY